ncbi:MAG: hypothetical protein ACRD3O_14015 [Terriglobia bacterium]
MTRIHRKKFVVCVHNRGQEASLLLRKIYEQLPDADAESEGQIRVIDEDGEDYLHPASYFIPIDLPKELEEAVDSAAELEAQHR